MRGPVQPRRKACGAVPACRLELRLRHEQALGQEGSTQVGTSKVGAEHVGESQVGAAEVGPDEVGAAQAYAVQVSTLQLGADEISSDAVLAAAGHVGAHHLADTGEQRPGCGAVSRDVEPFEVRCRRVHQLLRQVLSSLHLLTKLNGWETFEGLGEVPEQLLELPHDAKHREHRRGGARAFSPVLTGQRHLDDLLAGAEAVEDGTT